MTKIAATNRQEQVRRCHRKARIGSQEEGAIRVSGKDKVKPLQIHGFPTVLVARDDNGLNGPLVDRLRREGYNVLEAHDWADVFHFVSVHSRPIHLLLANVIMEAHVPILKEHRSELQVLLVKKPVNADDMLTKVRQLLGSAPSLASIR
jgi:hypothetical protein